MITRPFSASCWSFYTGVPISAVYREAHKNRLRFVTESFVLTLLAMRSSGPYAARCCPFPALGDRRVASWLPGDSMRCSNCGSENPDGAKFCDGCAAPLPLQCPSCGALNRASAKFCIECAAALGAVPAAARSSGAAQPARPEKDIIALGAPLEPHDVPDGERKTPRCSRISRARPS